MWNFILQVNGLGLRFQGLGLGLDRPSDGLFPAW